VTRVVPLHLFVTKSTELLEIIDCLRIHYHVKVNYESARITKSTLVKDRREHQCYQFTKIPAYIALVKHQNPEIHIHLVTTTAQEDNNQNAFQRLFICPHESRQSFRHMRKFLAVDGTFLKARFVQTLLFAVGIDGNGESLLLAWGVVESENTESWTWFLENLKSVIPETVGMTLISDRDKGLLTADRAVYGNGINQLICCFHLKGNFCKRYGSQLSNSFWQAANSKIRQDCARYMEDLRLQNPTAADYLIKIDPSLWVTAYYPAPHYGHRASNIVESMNSVFREDRELSILDLLNEVWHYTMDQRYR